MGGPAGAAASWCPSALKRSVCTGSAAAAAAEAGVGLNTWREPRDGDAGGWGFRVRGVKVVDQMQRVPCQQKMEGKIFENPVKIKNMHAEENWIKPDSLLFQPRPFLLHGNLICV